MTDQSGSPPGQTDPPASENTGLMRRVLRAPGLWLCNLGHHRCKPGRGTIRGYTHEFPLTDTSRRWLSYLQCQRCGTYFPGSLELATYETFPGHRDPSLDVIRRASKLAGSIGYCNSKAIGALETAPDVANCNTPGYIAWYRGPRDAALRLNAALHHSPERDSAEAAS